MDENTDKKEAVQPAEPELPIEADAPVREPVVFGAFDWLALAMGLGLAALWFRVFSLDHLMGVPGLGTTAFVLAALAAECVYLRGRVRPTRAGMYLTACTVLLAVAAGLFGDYAVRMIDLALLAFLTPASALALAGRGFPALEARLVPETLRLFFPGLFAHFTKPFLALRRRGRSFNGFWVVLLTLVLTAPLLVLVISLLSSADQVFSGMLESIGTAFLDSLDRGRFIWQWVKVAVFGLMLFSFLYSLARPAPEREGPRDAPSPLPCLPFIASLTALDIIYLVFAAIQVVFLFGGARTASMHGGSAQYARSGFFQLVAVAGINLCASLAATRAGGKGQAGVRALVWLLIGLTYVILVSAVYRMALYIGEYGLSLLRCMTLVIMLWLAVCLAAGAVRMKKVDLKVFPIFLASGLALWVVFNYVNIDKVIESWNTQAYEAGTISSYDEYYVDSLGPDSIHNSCSHWSDRVLFPRPAGGGNSGESVGGADLSRVELDGISIGWPAGKLGDGYEERGESASGTVYSTESCTVWVRRDTVTSIEADIPEVELTVNGIGGIREMEQLTGILGPGGGDSWYDREQGLRSVFYSDDANCINCTVIYDSRGGNIVWVTLERWS